MSDLIRRADAIKALYKYDFVTKSFIEREIKAIPSVDIPHSDDWEKYSDKLWKNAYERGKADRPQGEWITIDTKVVSTPVYWNEEQRQSDERGADIQEKCKCSACGWITNFVGYKKLGVNKSFNFCPNCGADMRNKDDE